MNDLVFGITVCPAVEPLSCDVRPVEGLLPLVPKRALAAKVPIIGNYFNLFHQNTKISDVLKNRLRSWRYTGLRSLGGE
jgi:hypothetical protein